MAHECFNCQSDCYCNGDIDDCVMSLTPSDCIGCGCVDDEEYQEEYESWLCACGHYEKSGLHCSRCGAQPPWGCPCSVCDNYDSDDPDDYPDEWEYEDY